MPLTFTVNAGETYPDGQKVTKAMLRNGALPTITATGTLAPADLAVGDYSAKFTPGPYFFAGSSAGPANTYSLAFTPAPAALVDGMRLSFRAHQTNGGAAVIVILGTTLPIRKFNNSALASGDLLINHIYEVTYNATLAQVEITQIGAQPAGVMGGASGFSNGFSGQVPAPVIGDQVKFLRGDATWVDVSSVITANAVVEIFKQRNFK